MNKDSLSPELAESVLDFWFEELTPPHWWKKSAALDQSIKDRFGAMHSAVSAGEGWQWRKTARGRLAEIVVLDQFSRNIYRDVPGAFAADGMALVLAQEAVAKGADNDLPDAQKIFLYMPYMHSESLAVHQQAVKLFDMPGFEHNLDFELKHKAIIERFGRYPHRNNILGRQSTTEEREFLLTPGSSF